MYIAVYFDKKALHWFAYVYDHAATVFSTPPSFSREEATKIATDWMRGKNCS